MDLIASMYQALHRRSVSLSLAVDWEHHGPAAWDASEDARDMLRLLAYVDRKAAVKAACACARTALQYLPPGEDRPLKSIETAEAWTRGEATEEQCREAAYAADAAAAYTADAAAAYAAWAAAYAAAAYAANAAYYAAHAAYAAAEATAAADAAYYAAHAAYAAAEATAAAVAGAVVNTERHKDSEKRLAAYRQAYRQAYRRSLRDLADVVRASASCPLTSKVVSARCEP